MIHMWRPWKLSNFQDSPPPMSIYVRNSFTPLTLDVQFQTNSLSHNDNQSIKRKHDPRMTIICYQQSNYRIIHHLQWLLLILQWLLLISGQHYINVRLSMTLTASTLTYSKTLATSSPLYVQSITSHFYLNLLHPSLLKYISPVNKFIAKYSWHWIMPEKSKPRELLSYFL